MQNSICSVTTNQLSLCQAHRRGQKLWTPRASWPLHIPQAGTPGEANWEHLGPIGVPAVLQGTVIFGAVRLIEVIKSRGKQHFGHFCTGTASNAMTHLQRTKTWSDSDPFWSFSPKLLSWTYREVIPRRENTTAVQIPHAEMGLFFGHCTHNPHSNKLLKCPQSGLCFPTALISALTHTIVSCPLHYLYVSINNQAFPTYLPQLSQHSEFLFLLLSRAEPCRRGCSFIRQNESLQRCYVEYKLADSKQLQPSSGSFGLRKKKNRSCSLSGFNIKMRRVCGKINMLHKSAQQLFLWPHPQEAML